MISCILLSAGFSSRFGSPKALARLNGATVIDYLLKNLVFSQVEEIIVVLGAHAEKIETSLLKHKKVKVVYNKDYNLGQTSSFKAGLRAVSQDATGIMLLPVDFPLVKRETIDRLVDFFLAENPPILIPIHNRRKGHPPIFSAGMKKFFLALDNTVGVNSFEHQYESGIVLYPVEDPGILKSFNTPQEFEELKKDFEEIY